MINIGTWVQINDGCVNPKNVGRIGTVHDVFYDDEDSEETVFRVVIEDGDDDDMSVVEFIALSNLEEM